MVAQATAEKRVPICPSASLSFAIHDWCHWFYMVDLDSETFQVFGNINGNRVYRSCHRSFVPAMIKTTSSHGGGIHMRLEGGSGRAR